MPRQYLTAKFRPTDKRSYTYMNDGDPVAVGDEVKLPSAREAEGWTRGTVFGLLSETEALALPYELKGIMGRVEREDAQMPFHTIDGIPADQHPDVTRVVETNGLTGEVRVHAKQTECFACLKPVADCDCLPF